MKRTQKALENEGLTSFQDCSELFSLQSNIESNRKTKYFIVTL